MSDVHHHHFGDAVVFHSHVEIQDKHPVAVSWWIGERHMREAGFVEECRDRTCSMRRHDDG